MSFAESPDQPVMTRIEAGLRRHPKRTMWIGVLLEVLAVGTIVGIVRHEARREAGLLDEATQYAWRLGWHDALHDRRFLPLVLLALLVYVTGAMLIALRWVQSRAGLFIGVPVAALLSAAVLGALVLVAALLVASDSGIGDALNFGLGTGDSGRRTRARRPDDLVAHEGADEGAG